jgi:Icc-related predicted phosphoesterase
MSMNRRHFLNLLGKRILAGGSIASGIPLIGCSEKSNTSRLLDLNGIEYKIKDGVISQTTKEAGQIKIGVMADLHAHKKNSEFFANQLDQECVDVYFLAGDLSHSLGDYEGAKDDFNEIISVVEPVAATGKLVLAVPGNHEQTQTYASALEHLTSKYPNVVDMNTVPVADLDGLTIVALGGSVNPRFCVQKGYLRSREDFEELGALVKQYQGDKPLLVATHIPQKYSTKRGLDVIDHGGSNVGGEELARVRRAMDSKFGVSGHIHEAYGLITPDEEPVNEGEFTDRLDFNPGAVYDHVCRNLKPAAGILEFKKNMARAYILHK